MSKKQLSALEKKEIEEIMILLKNFSNEDRNKIFYVAVGLDLAKQENKANEPEKAG